jgi:lysyl-tRNA synthetase class 2
VGPSLRDRAQADPDLLKSLHTFARLLTEVRGFFDRSGFVEVITPTLVPAPDPALHVESFYSELTIPGRGTFPLYLSTSPECQMKRMIGAGCERIYQIAHFFRNGEVTSLHNPEFLGVEWYQVGASVEELMSQTEELVRTLALRLTSGIDLQRVGMLADINRPFRRMSMEQALSELASVEVPADWNEDALREALQQAGFRTAADDSFDDLVNRALIERVEPKLIEIGPVFLYDYPTPMAGLARSRPERPWLAERFELYIGGLELCNGYGELSDAREQRARLLGQIEERVKRGKARLPLDEAFLCSLEQGLPACSGNALGLERLAMLLLGKEHIEQVQAFPLSIELDLGVR